MPPINPLTVVKSAVAHLRVARSVLTGSLFHLPSLAHLVRAGAAGQAKPALPSKPNLRIVQHLQEYRIRHQVRVAARDTGYYADLFVQCGLNVREFTAAHMAELPLTSKEALRQKPEAFVRHGFQPTLGTMTTGTTGQGTTTLFTMRETQIFSLLSALGLGRRGIVSSADVVQMSTSARALLGNQTVMDALRHLGTLVYQTGIIDPTQALALLTKQHSVPGRKKRASVLVTYPSYLGKLVETGLALGYGPQDFGLERINIGGEVSSPGLRQRSEALFGPVTFDEGYGISEVWPFGGTYCEAGHLHFDQLRGLMELINPDTGQPGRPGEAGSLVLTPFLPYRESTILLRYDTGDLARALVAPCECSLSHKPATGPLLGKRRFCVYTEQGWFGPWDILNVLEPNNAVPLPARFGLWATAEGLDLEVVVREASAKLQQDLIDQLQSAKIPVSTLHLVTDPTRLKRPLPWRGDLYEHTFPN